MTTTTDINNNVSNGDAGVVATSPPNGAASPSASLNSPPELPAVTQPEPSKAEGGLNRGWSFPGKSAAVSTAHAPIRSSPLAAKEEPALEEIGMGATLTVPGQQLDKPIQRAASPLDQLLAKRAAAAAGRSGLGAHRRSESMSSASGPPPGLGNLPVPTARPRFRTAHGRSTSLSLPTAAGGIPGLGGNAPTRQPIGPSAGGIHSSNMARPRSGTFQRDPSGGASFQPGHLSSASLSHAFGSSIITSSWGKESGSGHHHSQSHHFGHNRVASLGAPSAARNVDELVDRDIGDGMLSNVVRTLDSLGLKEEGAAAAAASGAGNSLGLGVRPISHRTRSRSLLGGSAATNAAVLGDVSPSTGAPLHRLSGVSHFLKTHSRPRAISLDYFNPSDYEDEADLLESHRSSQQGSPTETGFGFDYDEASISERQAPTRSLWIGNLPAHVTSTDLMQIFSEYGAIESLRVLPNRDCAFINFHQLEDALRAHDDMSGARLGGSLIRVGFGKVDVYGTDMQGMQPTRALWVGNISPHTTSQILSQVFSPFGPIESVRVLTHKNCGFVNFERTEDSMRAKSVMNGQEIAGAIVRIGFAKVPALESSPSAGNTPSASGASASATGASGTSPTMSAVGSRGRPGDAMHSQSANNGFSFPSNKSSSATTNGDHAAGVSRIEGFNGEPLGINSTFKAFPYKTSLPPLPPVNPHRRTDASRLRDIRKRLDAHPTSREVDSAFTELYADCVELSFDYIGNTVMQKLAEHGTDEQKLRLLRKVAPEFAAIGIHKNGTWAVQKMIDTASTPQHMNVICEAIKPFTPPLLLDQFGNYVVQCCLRFGPDYNQFIFEAMHARCLEIAQGRFGARSMRTCLENPLATPEQKMLVASAIASHLPHLVTSANGSLLINWLIDSSDLPGRYRVLASVLASQITQFGAHKLASGVILKMINQQEEPEARNVLVHGLFGAPGTDVNADTTRAVESILEDQSYGVGLIHKIFTCNYLTDAERRHVAERIRLALGRITSFQSAMHRRLSEEVIALVGATPTGSASPSASQLPTAAGIPSIAIDPATMDQNAAQQLLNALASATVNGGMSPSDDAISQQQQLAMLSMMGLSPQVIQANAAYLLQQNPALATILQQQQQQQQQQASTNHLDTRTEDSQ